MVAMTPGLTVKISNGKLMRQHGGIYFVTTSNARVGHVKSAHAALRGGVRIVQYRNKNGDMRTMLDEARKIKKLCKSYNALFIVDDRVDLALAVDADGVHLGQEDMPIKIARQLLPGKIIGASAKTPKQAVEAQRDGATYLGVGAIFPTKTKVKTIVIGLRGFEKVRNMVTIPVYGIGGLKLEHVSELEKRGADGMAVITAISDDKNPQTAARQLVKAWKNKLRT